MPVRYSSPCFAVLRSSAFKFQTKERQKQGLGLKSSGQDHEPSSHSRPPQGRPQNPSQTPGQGHATSIVTSTPENLSQTNQTSKNSSKPPMSVRITNPAQIPGLTQAQIRLVVDTSKVNKILENEYSNFNITQLTHYDIGSFVYGSSYLSTLDVSLAFNSVLVRKQDRPLLGIKIAQLNVLRSVVLLMGISISPQCFHIAMQNVFEQDIETNLSTLIFFDDVLVHSKKPDVSHYLESKPQDGRQGSNEGQSNPSRDPIQGQPQNVRLPQECVGGRPQGHKLNYRKGPPCPNCKNIQCTGCKTIGIAPTQEIKDEHFAIFDKVKIHTIPPKRKDVLYDLFEKYDVNNLLPKEKIIANYHCFPLQKGNDWPTCLEEEMPKYEEKTDPNYSEKELKQHLINLSNVLHSIRRTGTKISLKKCTLLSKSIDYMGHTFDKYSIGIIPGKKEYLQKYRSIKTCKELQQYLGSILQIGFHLSGLASLSRFLYNFSSSPPNTKLKPIHKKVVNIIIDKIMEAEAKPIIPDNVPLILVADSSAIAVGICLGWNDSAGRFIVSHYHSIALPPTLCSISHIAKELFSYAAYLSASPHLFQREFPTCIVMDNRALHLLCNYSELPPSGRLAKHLNLLRSFPIKLKFRWRRASDKRVLLSDALSRLYHYSYFTIHSSSRKEIESIIKQGEYKEDLSKIQIPESVAMKDWDISQLDLLREMYENQFFPLRKSQRGIPRTEFLQQICSTALCTGSTTDENYPLSINQQELHFPDYRQMNNLRLEDNLKFEVAAIARDLQGNSNKRNLISHPTTYVSNTVQQILVASLRETEVLGDPYSKGRMTKVWRKSYFSVNAIREDQRQDNKLGPIIKLFLENDLTKIPNKVKKKYELLSSFILAKRDPATTNSPIILPQASAILMLASMHVYHHCSIEALIAGVKNLFYIPNLTNLAKLVVHNCWWCISHRTTNPYHCTIGRLLDIGDKPFSVITTDPVTIYKAFHDGKTMHHVCCIRDTFSKSSTYIPMKTLTSRDVIHALRTHFYSTRVPDKILSDQGACYVSEMFKNFVDSLHITHKFHTPWSSYCHASERENLLFTQLTSLYMAVLKDRNWLSVLSQVNMALKALPREYTLLEKDEKGEEKIVTRKLAPYTFLHGMRPPSSMDDMLKQHYPNQAIPEEIMRLRSEVMKAHDEAVQYERKMFTQEDDAEMAQKKASLVLKPGDHVVYRKLPRVKYTPPYHSQIFEVISINRRTVTLRPIFARKPQYVNVHTRFVKRVTLDHSLFKDLPPSLKNHLGGGIKIPSTIGAHNKPVALRSTWPAARAARPTRPVRRTRSAWPAPAIAKQSNPEILVHESHEEMESQPGNDDGSTSPFQQTAKAVESKYGAAPQFNLLYDASDMGSTTISASSNHTSVQSNHSTHNTLNTVSSQSNQTEVSQKESESDQQTPKEKLTPFEKIKKFLSPAPPPRFPAWSPGERDYDQQLRSNYQPIPFRLTDFTPPHQNLQTLPQGVNAEATPPPLEPIPNPVPLPDSLLRRSSRVRRGTRQSDYTYY